MQTVKAVAAAISALARKEPTVVISAIAAGAVELAAAVDVADVHDWTGVVLVAVSLLVRRRA